MRWILLVLVLCNTITRAETNSDLQQLEQEAQQLTKQFAGQLKAILQGTMITAGPVRAIQVCRINAPQIAQAMSEQWQVARTSSQVRNPNNAPDPWEAAVLEEWEDKIAHGALVKNMRKSERVSVNGRPTYRYMQAIVMGDMCLNCHGKHLSGPVQQALKDLYSSDQATGYSKGELRGAFSLQKPL